MAGPAKNTIELLEAIHMSLSDIAHKLEKPKHGQKDGFYDGSVDGEGKNSNGLGALLSGKGSISKSAFGNASMSAASLAEVGKGLLALNKVGKPKKVGEYLDKVAEFVEKMTKFSKGFDKSKTKDSIQSMKDFGEGLSTLLKTITLRKLFTLKMAGLVMNEKTGKKIGKFYSTLVKYLKKGVSKADRKFMRSVADLTNGIWKLLLVLIGAIVVLTVLVTLNLKATLIALGIVTVLLGIVIGAFILIGKFMTSKEGKRAHKGMKDFADLVKAMAILMGTIIIVGIVAYFIPIEALALGIGIMFAVLLSIWGLSKILNKADGEGKGGKLIKAIWSYIALLAAVTVVLFALRWMVRDEEEMKKTLIAGAILISVMALLLGVTWALNQLTKKIDIKQMLKGVAIIISLAGVIFVVTWIIYQSMQFFKVIEEYGWDKFAMNMLYLAGAILAMGVVVYAMGSLVKSGEGALTALAGAATAIALAGLILGIAWIFVKTLEYFTPIDEYGWGNFEINVLWMQLILLTAALIPTLLGALEVLTGGVGALVAVAGIATAIALAGMIWLISWMFVKALPYFEQIDEYGWGNFEINILWMQLILLTAALIPTLLGALEVLTGGIGAIVAVAGIATAIALAGMIWLISWMFVKALPYFEQIDEYGWGNICINVLWISLILLEMGVLVTITGLLGTLLIVAIPGIILSVGLLFLISWGLTQILPYFEQIDEYGWGNICINVLWIGLILLELGAVAVVVGALSVFGVVFILAGIIGTLLLIAFAEAVMVLIQKILDTCKLLDESDGTANILVVIFKIMVIVLAYGFLIGVIGGLVSAVGGICAAAGWLGMQAMHAFQDEIYVLIEKIIKCAHLIEENGGWNIAGNIIQIAAFVVEYSTLVAVIGGLLSAIGGITSGLGALGMKGIHVFQDQIYKLIEKIIKCAHLIEENGGWNITEDIIKIGAIIAEYNVIMAANGVLSTVCGLISTIGKLGLSGLISYQESIHKLISKIIETADLVRIWEEKNPGQTVDRWIIKIGEFLDAYNKYVTSKGSGSSWFSAIKDFFSGNEFEDMYENMKHISSLVISIMDLADELSEWYKKHEGEKTIQDWLSEVGSILDSYEKYISSKGGDGGGFIDSIINFFSSASYETSVGEMKNIAKLITIISDLADNLYTWYREHPGSRPIANWLKEVGNMLNAYQSLKFQEPDEGIDEDYLNDSILILSALKDWTKACFTMLGYVSNWIKSTPGVESISDASSWLKSYFSFCNTYVDSLNALGSHIENDYDYGTVSSSLLKLQANSKQILKISTTLRQIMKQWPIKGSGILSGLSNQSDEDESVRIQTIMNNLAEALIIWGTKDFTRTNENISKLTPIIVNNLTSIIDILKQTAETSDSLTNSLDELGAKFDDVLIRHKDERVQALEEVRQSFDKVSESIDKVRDSMQQLQEQDFETLSNNIQMVAESFMKAFEEWNATNAVANPDEFNAYADQAESEGTTWREKSTAERTSESNDRMSRGGGTTIVNQGQQGGYQGSRNITVYFGAKAIHGRFEFG